MFTPRHLIERTSEGTLLVVPSAARPAATSGPTYVYRCSWCKKTLERKQMDGTLRPHENPTGHACGGRVGIYVRTRH